MVNHADLSWYLEQGLTQPVDELLDELVKRLELDAAEAKRIIASARDGAIAVGNRLLEDAD